MTPIRNLVHFSKGSNTYIFVFDDSHVSQVIQTLARFANREDLSLSWYDAALLTQRVREMVKEKVGR